MKRLCIIGLLLCSLCSVASAQSKRSTPFDKYFAESSAQYWTGVVLDYRSSLSKREANPLFQNRAGEISGAKYFGVNGGIYLLTVALQNKHPRFMNWTRRIHGWVHISVAGHNHTIPQRR